MDITTLSIAVDSTQVNTAAAALDRMAQSGGKAENSSSVLTRTAQSLGRALGILPPVAQKTADSVADIGDAGKAIGSQTFGAPALAQAATQADKAGKAVGTFSQAASKFPTGNAKDYAAATKQIEEALNKAAIAEGRAADARNRLATATAKVEQAERLLNAAQSRPGGANPDAVDAAQARLNDALRVQASAQAKANLANIAAAKATADHQKALDGLGKSQKATAFQTAQLSAQLQDFFVQVQAGGSPLTAAIQQGSQLSAVYGGFKPAFQGILGLITPVRAALIGLGATVGVVALAAKHTEDWSRALGDLQAQLQGTGRNFTNTAIASLIEQIAQAPNVTREAATQTVSELAKVKGIGEDLFGKLAKLAADYARATGTDIPTAAKTLGKAFADPAEGAKTLENALGRLSSTTLATVQRLVEQGRTVEAQRVLYDGLKDAVNGLAEKGITPLQKATNELGNAWDKAMGTFRESDGLKNVNSILAQTIGLLSEGIKKLPEFAEKLRQTPGLSTIGGMVLGGPIGGAVGIANDLAGARPSQGGGGGGGGAGTPADNELARQFARARSAAATAQAVDEEIKAALALGKQYKSTGDQIDDLLQKRSRLISALKKAPANSDVAKELTDQVAGINERITTLRKRGAGNEPNQVREALLRADINTVRDLLADERDEFEAHNRELTLIYQAGNKSLQDYFDERDRLAQQSTQRRLNLNIDEQARLEVELKNPLVKADPSKEIQLRDQLADAVRRGAEIQREADQRAVQSTYERQAAVKALKREVEDFRANLAELSGDPIGAAAIRAEQQIRQIEELVARSKKTSGANGESLAISPEQESAAKQAIRNQVILQRVQIETSQINERLAIEEERIALRAQTGIISETQALIEQGNARRSVVSRLEEQLRIQEEVFQSNPNPQLLLNIERTRLELDKLKESLDPLKAKFDQLFQDAGTSFFERLFANPKDWKAALEDSLKTVRDALFRQMAQDTSQAIFGRDGPLGGLGGIVSRSFGGGAANAAADAAGQAAAQAPVVAAITTASTTETTALSTVITSSSATQVAQASAGTAAIVGAIGASTTAIVTAITSQGAVGAAIPSSAFASGDLLSLFFHDGGIVGQTSDRRPVSPSVFRGAAKYHSGGIVSGKTKAALQANEVPAILMGGPKGTREEVLTAKDPRHKDNLGNQLLKMVEGRSVLNILANEQAKTDKDKGAVAGLIKHDKETRQLSPLTRFLMGSPDTVSAIVRELLKEKDFESVTSLEHLKSGQRAIGGPVSPNRLYRVNERGPELLQMAGKQYLMTGANGGEVKTIEKGDTKPSTTNVFVQHAPAGTTVERRRNASGGEDVFVKIKQQIKDEMRGEVRNGGGILTDIVGRTGINPGAGLVV